jgi:hypothetical protein
MDDLDMEIDSILAGCANDDDLKQRIMKHARILQRLACCMVKGEDNVEDRIRTLYSDLADLAVEHIDDARVFPSSKLH